MLAAMFSGRHSVIKDPQKGVSSFERDGTHFCKNMEEKSPHSSAFRQDPCCYSIKLGQRLHAAVSTNNGAMGNEEAASKN